MKNIKNLTNHDVRHFVSDVMSKATNASLVHNKTSHPHCQTQNGSVHDIVFMIHQC